MQKSSLSISLSNPARTIPALIVEQGAPATGDGYLSRGGMFKALLSLAGDEDPEAQVDCTSEIGVAIYVYRYNLALAYALKVSHGYLGDPVVEDDLTFTQKIQFNMEDSASLKYPNFGLVDVTWLGGNVWDGDGSKTTEPSHTVDISEIKLSKKVYGTAMVTYKINRDFYGCQLPAREAAEENKFSSVAYAIFNGGVVWEELTPPDGVEESGRLCIGGGGSLSVTPRPPSGEPTAPHTDGYKDIDYCSGEVLRDDSAAN